MDCAFKENVKKKTVTKYPGNMGYYQKIKIVNIGQEEGENFS